MNTSTELTKTASTFRREVKVALARKEWSVTALAGRIGKSRNSTSRAINRGEFKRVQTLIRKELDLS